MTTLMTTPIQLERIIECHNQVVTHRKQIVSLFGQDMSPYQILDDLRMCMYTRGLFEKKITPSECSDPEARRKLWKDEKARIIALADMCYQSRLESAMKASSQKGVFKATIFVAHRIFEVDREYYHFLGDERQMIQSWLNSHSSKLGEFSFSLYETTGCADDLYPRDYPVKSEGFNIILHW